MDVKPQDLPSFEIREFKEDLSLLNKHNEVNPMITESNREQLSPTISKSPVFKINFHTKSFILAMADKRYFLNPAHMGWLELSKISLKSKDLNKDLGRKFWFCLDFLPRKKSIELRNPIQTYSKADDELLACIFWFQNKEQYETLVKETSTMCVRSKDFQIRFS
jgi:hypothetical protein